MTDNYYVLIVIAMAGTCLLVVFFILLQIRNQNKLLLQQKKLQEVELHHQKELLHAVIVSQEEERTRIGMDLHDEACTVLSSLRMTIDNFANTPGMPAAAGQLGVQSKYIIDNVIKNVRSISHNLSPFTAGAYDFIDAIEDICDHINQSREITIDLQYPPNGALSKLPDMKALALYRVITELINNTVKHAHARNIALSFDIKDSLLVIDYKDDGIGMAAGAAKKGMGMRNIESRLGLVEAGYTIDGDRGFALRARIPL